MGVTVPVWTNPREIQYPIGAASSKPTTQLAVMITAPAAVPGGVDECAGPVRCGGTKPAGGCHSPAKQSMQLQPDQRAGRGRRHYLDTALLLLVVRGEFLPVAQRAISAAVPIRSPLSRGRPRRRVRGGARSENTAGERARVVMVISRPSPANAPQPYAASATTWIARSANRSASASTRSRARSGVDRPPRDRQGGQHRQRDRARQRRQRHDDRRDHPIIPEP